jgi:glycine/D-amino acid oxidase-like deaminating enzyme
MLSFWEKNAWTQADIIIVGAGILGCSLAAELLEKKPKQNILILERGLFPTGASTRNAGFACFGSPSEILADIQLMGEDAAAQLVAQRWQGLKKLRSRFSDTQMGLENFGGYELLAEDEKNVVEAIPYLNQLLSPLFGKSVFEDASHLIKDFGFNTKRVAFLPHSPLEAQINSGILIRSMQQYVSQLGARIVSGAEMLRYEAIDGKVNVAVKDDFRSEEINFVCSHLFLCTNANLEKMAPKLGIKPGRGQVIITKPIPNLPFKGTFHIQEGFYYFRNMGNRILFGGGRQLDFEGECTKDFGQSTLIQEDLEEKLFNLIAPQLSPEIEMRWSGIMAFTPDKRPLVQSLESNVHAAVTCNGMGVALASLTAMHLAKLTEEA